MDETSAETAGRWDLENHQTTSGETLNELHQRLDYCERTHYRQYLPTFGSRHPDFWARFRGWLENVRDEADKRILFELAPNVAFFSREDFSKLYQAALRGPITRWVIEHLGLNLDAGHLESKVSEEISHHTWFCPLTDSMAISDFHHANNLGGINFRPDWKSLATFGHPDRITEFMANHRDANHRPQALRRIVILEDFIGSGTQMVETVRSEGGVNCSAVEFAASLSADIPVLLVPLIVCPEGADQARRFTSANLTVSPVLELKPDEFVEWSVAVDPKELMTLLSDLAHRTYADVVGDGTVAPRPYTRLGVGRTGGLIVTYSNTPANTLPIIQHGSNTWDPLFPRSARIK